MTPKAIEPDNTIDSEVDEILDVAITQAVLCGLEVDGAFDELTIRKEAYGKITNLIAQEANKARLQELEQFTHSEGSIHILAEKVSYQPANHDPVHSWPVINGKVIIISQDYVKDRKAELLQRLTADKEQAALQNKTNDGGTK